MKDSTVKLTNLRLYRNQTSRNMIMNHCFRFQQHIIRCWISINFSGMTLYYIVNSHFYSKGCLRIYIPYCLLQSYTNSFLLPDNMSYIIQILQPYCIYILSCAIKFFLQFHRGVYYITSKPNFTSITTMDY